MIANRPPIRFAAPKSRTSAWPYSPVLELPGGNLRNHECGRILTAQAFVLAVGLSPHHYMAVARAPGTGPVQQALEQCVGFLAAHAATVIRVALRCPIDWFANNLGDLDWKKCLVFFTRTFLATDPTDPHWIPPMIVPVAPLGVIASVGFDHWRRVNEVLEGVTAADSDLLTQFGSSLAAMARRWEIFLARMVILSQRAGEYDAGDGELVALCDRLLFSIMSRFEPRYELLPVTTQRLL